MSKRILIVAGEVSGDLHAAGLIQEMLKLHPNLEFFGIGGEEMKKKGVRLLYHVDQLSFMGFWEVLKHLKFIRQVRRGLLQEVDSNNSKLAILVDYPGLNLKLAEDLKKRSLKVVYYISPQVWAWGEKRIQKIKKYVDKMIVFFPFEKELYEKHSIKVEFTGHPLLQLARPKLSRTEFYQRLNANGNQRFIGLFPGSRPQEVKQHLPIMLKAGEKIRAKKEEVEFLIGLAPGIPSDQVRKSLPPRLPVQVLKNFTYEIMSYSELLLVKSGTSTLEAALCGTPFVVMYKVNPLSYLVAKRLVKIPHLAMANILAGRKIVPEFIQNQAQPDKIADEIIRLLEDQKRYQSVKSELSQIRSKLGAGQPYHKAAQAIAEFL